MLLIGVHEMHGQMPPQLRSYISLLAHDPLSSLAYHMIVDHPQPSGSQQFAYKNFDC